jgi:hypothetical protein
VLDLEHPQGLGIAIGTEARSVVGHDALDPDPMRPEEAQGIEQEAQA